MIRLQYSTKALPPLSSCWPDSLQHGKDLPDRYLNTGVVLDRITQVPNGVAAITARNNMRDYHLLTANCQTFVLEVMKEIIEHSGPNDTPVTPPGNTVTTGLMSSKRPIALGSFSFLLVALGMFPLALRMCHRHRERSSERTCHSTLRVRGKDATHGHPVYTEAINICMFRLREPNPDGAC
jgi:hypothetical protein